MGTRPHSRWGRGGASPPRRCGMGWGQGTDGAQLSGAQGWAGAGLWRPGLAPRTLPDCSSPCSHLFKTSWSLGPFCCWKLPSCPAHFLLLLGCWPAWQPPAGLYAWRDGFLLGVSPSAPNLAPLCQAGEPPWCSGAKLLPERRAGNWSTIKQLRKSFLLYRAFC